MSEKSEVNTEERVTEALSLDLGQDLEDTRISFKHSGG